ncbi:MAG: hypothetical protein HC905_01300 [Bacteroidales bacterium]|nr:hypothetical protein [Bacteroidales bacterium]
MAVLGLESNTTYYYRLRAENASGQSLSSNIISTTTLVPIPGAPVAQPATNITSTSFKANWDALVGATNYRLDVSLTNDFLTRITGLDDLSVTGTSFNITGLTGGTTYYYRVRGENIAGEGENSPIISTLTIPKAPVLSATTGVTATGFTANWAASTGATKYFFDLSTLANFTTFVGLHENEDIGNVTTLAVSGLSPGNTYYYRIRAVNASGISENSEIKTLSTIAGAPVANAATLITATSFQANWTTVTGAIKYRLDVALDANFTSMVPGYNNLDAGLVLTYNISGLQGGTTYYYRLRAENGSGAGPSSSSITVLTLPAAPVAALATLAKSSSFQANWAASTGATKYRIDVSTTNTFSPLITGFSNLDVGNVTTISVTGLTYSTTYYYRVRAENTQGVSLNSNIITIATTLPEPVSLETVGLNAITSQITNTSPQIQYSLDSTSTHNGTWVDCQLTNTTVDFANGGIDVWVRQKNLISNKRKAGTLATKVNLISGVTYNLVNRTVSGLNNQEQYRMNGGAWSTVVTNVTFEAGKFEVQIPATITTLASTIQEIGTITVSEIAFANIQRYTQLNDASELTPEMLTEAGVTDVIPENITGYQNEIEAANSITTLSQVQNLVNRSNAFYTINYIVQSRNSSSLTTDMMTTAGVTGANNDYLEAYKEAIIYSDPFSDIATLQEFVDLVNVMMDISLMATNNDASSLTIDMIIKTGVTDANPTYLEAYKVAIEAENSISDKNHLQNVTNKVNLQQSIFKMAETNNAATLTINQLENAGIIDAYDVNLWAYKNMIIEKDQINNLDELQEIVNKTNAQQYLITKTVLNNPSDFKLTLLNTAGITGGIEANIPEYIDALDNSPALATITEFQLMINKVNKQQAIFAMAQANDATALTTQMMVDAGLINIIDNYLADYKTIIVGADIIQNLAELQELIEVVNTRHKIYKMAISNDASELTIAMLQQAGIEQTETINLNAYKTAIVADSEIISLIELQEIIIRTNAQQLIFTKTILQSTNLFTTSLLLTVGVTNASENYLVSYLEGIDAAISIETLADLQTIINQVNAQKVIFAMAVNNYANDLTAYMITTAGITGVNANYLTDYKKIIVDAEVIQNKDELQALINKINLRHNILKMAETNDASSVTMDLLAEAGLIEIYDVNLEAYKKAIVAEESIPDMEKLQQIIIRTNSQEFIFTKTVLQNTAAFTVSLLETAGTVRVKAENLSLYLLMLETGEALNNLAEFQALVDMVNSQQLIFNMPITKDTSKLTVELLTTGGITDARTDKLQYYKEALADSTTVLDIDKVQVMVNYINKGLKIQVMTHADFKVYPVPTRNYLTIESLKPFNYKLINSEGRIISASSEKTEYYKLDLSKISLEFIC